MTETGAVQMESRPNHPGTRSMGWRPDRVLDSQDRVTVTSTSFPHYSTLNGDDSQD